MKGMAAGEMAQVERESKACRFIQYEAGLSSETVITLRRQAP
jgi:hypothetical protein